jgi:hypothetical protein
LTSDQDVAGSNPAGRAIKLFFSKENLMQKKVKEAGACRLGTAAAPEVS